MKMRINVGTPQNQHRWKQSVSNFKKHELFSILSPVLNHQVQFEAGRLRPAPVSWPEPKLRLINRVEENRAPLRTGDTKQKRKRRTRQRSPFHLVKSA